MKRACVIGAGFGGLALAIRLQAGGVATTLIEARERPGGQAFVRESMTEKNGTAFAFEGGNALIADPQRLADLWGLCERNLADDVELLAVAPACRFNWTDGTTFDLAIDEAGLHREIARIAPGDLAGFQEYTAFAAAAGRDLRTGMGMPRQHQALDLLRSAPAMVRDQLWRSAYGAVSRFVKSDKLREALSFAALRMGGNPVSPGSALALIQSMAQAPPGDGTVWCAAGGTCALAAAMAALFKGMGGTLRLHDPVLHIHTLGNRASEVESASGWQERFDAVASNADMMHSYRDLLGDSARGADMARRLKRRRWSPGQFVVHFALEGTWPGVPHTMVLFGPRFKGMFDDVFDSGVLPRDMMIELHHPTVTDPSRAPPGKSLFSAAVPVANMGKLPVDWDPLGPMMERRILDEIGRRLIPDIHDRIITSFHLSPRDRALELNAYVGSAHGLEPVLSQQGWLGPHIRDDRIGNFYLAGAGCDAGPGICGALGGATITAALMLEDMK